MSLCGTFRRQPFLGTTLRPRLRRDRADSVRLRIVLRKACRRTTRCSSWRLLVPWLKSIASVCVLYRIGPIRFRGGIARFLPVDRPDTGPEFRQQFPFRLLLFDACARDLSGQPILLADGLQDDLSLPALHPRTVETHRSCRDRRNCCDGQCQDDDSFLHTASF